MPQMVCNGLKGYPCGRLLMADPLSVKTKLCPTCRALRARIGNRGRATQLGYRRVSRR